MRNAARILIILAGAATLGACHKSQPQAANNSAMSLDDPAANSQAPDNTQFETLPPDESSTTSSKELQNGQDSPDVNSLGNGD